MPSGSTLHPHPESSSQHNQALAASSKTTHIRNKDGTKLIAVPSRKVSNSESTSATPSPPPSPPPAAVMDYSNGANPNNAAGKKKKKKRGKHPQQILQNPQQSAHRRTPSLDDGEDYGYDRGSEPVLPNDTRQYQQDIRDSMVGFQGGLGDAEDDDDEYYSDQDNAFEDDEPYSPPRSAPAPAPAAGKSKKNKKKKKKGGSGVENPGEVRHVQTRKTKDRIWNTSTSEERERIKDFWLSLGEEERRSLVKVEKEAVLRKMKEQQKHSCSCSVCGRKRTAIEEELEVLYDAYYEELEQYANQQQSNKYISQISPNLPSSGNSTHIPPPPRLPGPPSRTTHRNQVPNHRDQRVEELDDDDEFEEEEEDDEDEILEHPLSPLPHDPRPDFFNFGNSLTVQGGILTVADDLLKNDGKKFIEMMEQLAERRMAREEEANGANGTAQREANLHHQHVHNHAQPEYEDEEDYDEEDEDEDYDDEEEDDEEPDTMTEEQRMEEGRRMFQIFAARMFEQRVLTAYREKVARERQRRLLEELEEEERRKEEREAKKAQDKDKRKEKKRQQKQAKEEERLRRETEKREEEERLKAVEAKKADELRKRKEEQRLKRESERKAAEEERLKKEEEKRKRIQEEKEREAERERKRKEHQERERKKRDETAKKAREEKEAKEREVREKREWEEKERKEREAKVKREADEKERKRREEEARARAEAAAIIILKRSQTTTTAATHHPPQTNSQPVPPPGYGSPHLAVVTPALPKQQNQAARNTSQQGSVEGSQGSSPRTPNIAPRIGSSASPSTPLLQQTAPGPVPVKGFQFPGFGPSSPMPHHIAPPPGVAPAEGLFNMSPIGMNGPNHMQPFLPNLPQRQSISNGIPLFPPGQMPLGPSPQYRGFAAPNGMPMQIPTAPGMRSMGSQGRGAFMGDIPHQLPPGVALPPPGSPFINRVEPIPMSGHSRMPSAGAFDYTPRPTPIQRPSSVAPQRNGDDHHSSIDELSKVMGSRALLEDDGEPLPENMSPTRRVSGPQFAPRPIRGVPTSSPLFGDTLGSFSEFSPSWSNPIPLGGNLSGSLPSAWANKAGWSDIDAGAFNRRRTNRLDHIRILACQKFRELSGPNNPPVEAVTLQKAVRDIAPPDFHFAMEELTHILDVEGDPQNGGGSFDQRLENGRVLVYYTPDASGDLNHHGPSRAGEIGSPGAPFRTPLGPPGMATSPAGF